MIPGAMVFMERLLITLIITSIIVLPAPAQSTPQPTLISLSSSVVSRGTNVIIKYDAYRDEEGLNITFSNGEVLAATQISTDGDTARYHLIYTVPFSVSFRAYSYSGAVRTAEGYADSNGYTGHWIREVGTPAPVIAGHNASLDLVNTGEWTAELGSTIEINVTLYGYGEFTPEVSILSGYRKNVLEMEALDPTSITTSLSSDTITYDITFRLRLRTRYLFITLNSSYGYMGQDDFSTSPNFQRVNNGFGLEIVKNGRYNDTHTFRQDEPLNYTLTVRNEANMSLSFKLMENYSSDVRLPLSVRTIGNNSLIYYILTAKVLDGVYLVVSLTDELINSTEVIAQYVIAVFNGSTYLRFSNPVVSPDSEVILGYEVVNSVSDVRATNITLVGKDWNTSLLVDETKVRVRMKTPGNQLAYFVVNNTEGVVHNQSITLIWDVTEPSASLNVTYNGGFIIEITAEETGENNSFIQSIDLGYRGLRERVFDNISLVDSERFELRFIGGALGYVNTISLVYNLTLQKGNTNFTLTVTDLAGNSNETWFEVVDETDPGVTTVLFISSGVVVTAVVFVFWRTRRS